MTDPKSITKHNYSQISKLWIEDFSSYRENFELIIKAIELIKSMKLQDRKVCDLGSGSGTVADFLLEKGLRNIEVVEFVPEFIRLLEQKYSGIKSVKVVDSDIVAFFKQSLKDNIKFRESFIAHFASYSIIHIPDDEVDELFQNIHETLMKGGIFVMSCQEGMKKGYEQDPYQTNNDSRLKTKEELYGLTSQIRRCSISIPSNIAEGSRRSTRKDFAHFISIAYGSASELETQIEVSRRLGYLKDSEYTQLNGLTEEVLKMLNRFSSSLQTTNYKL